VKPIIKIIKIDGTEHRVDMTEYEAAIKALCSAASIARDAGHKSRSLADKMQYDALSRLYDASAKALKANYHNYQDALVATLPK